MIIRKNIKELKGEIYSYTWGLQHSLSATSRAITENQQEHKRSEQDNQQRDSNIYRTFYTTAVEYTFSLVLLED